MSIISPQSRSAIINGAGVSGQDFTGTPQTGSLTVTITPAATVTINSDETTTDIGNYTRLGVTWYINENAAYSGDGRSWAATYVQGLGGSD